MTVAERYKIADAYFTVIEQELFDDMEKSNYPRSLIIFYSIVKTIDQLKDGIVATQNHSYAAHIILRSIIENFLLTFYFYLKIKIDQSDNIGIDYMDSYANSEFFKQESYSLQLEDIKKGIKRTIDINALRENFPMLDEITQADIQSYHETASQFNNTKKIGQFIIENRNIEPTLEKLSYSVFELLDTYNILSSIVHGGPYAMRTFINKEDRQIAAIPYSNEVLADWGYTMAHIAKVNLLLTMRNEVDSKYAKHFKVMYSMDNPNEENNDNTGKPII